MILQDGTWLVSKESLQAFEDCEIIEVKGFSGVPCTVEQATGLPFVTQVHAMSGNVYDVEGYDKDEQVFTLTPYYIVYVVE